MYNSCTRDVISSPECNKHIIKDSTLLGNECSFRRLTRIKGGRVRQKEKKIPVHACHQSINSRNGFLLSFCLLLSKKK